MGLEQILFLCFFIGGILASLFSWYVLFKSRISLGRFIESLLAMLLAIGLMSFSVGAGIGIDLIGKLIWGY
jgi:hypothetical protein